MNRSDRHSTSTVLLVRFVRGIGDLRHWPRQLHLRLRH